MTGRLLLAAVSALLLLSPGPARAQEAADTLRALYRLPGPAARPDGVPTPRTPPGSSAGSPTAFGAGWGQVFAGAGYQQRARYSTGTDGTAVAGFGLGNPRTLVGAEVAFTSFSTINSGFLNRSGVSVKLHRVLPSNVGVAVGWENAWTSEGTSPGDGASDTFYAVVSRVIKRSDAAFGTFTASVGVGNGRFRSEQRILDDQDGVGVFASLGIRVLDPVSVIIDWTGQDLALAYSITPFRSLPLVLSPAIVDLTGSAGDGPRFTLGIGVGTRLFGRNGVMTGY